MITIRLKNVDEASEFLLNEREIIYNLIISKIKTNYELKSVSTVRIIEIILLEEASKVEIEVARENWCDSLGLALEFFEKIEGYEKCLEIKDLINKVKNG